MNKLMVLKSRRSKALLLVSAIMATGAAPALAQIKPMGVVPAQAPKPAPQAAKPAAQAAKPAHDAPAPGNADYAPAQAVGAQEAAPPPAPPLPPAMWDVVSAEDLLRFIQQVGAEGLNPADYDPAGLQAAIQARDPVAMSAAATQRFNQLSSDLALGHVKRPARIDWHVVDGDLNAEKQDALLRRALAERNITAALTGLLPTHPQYAALKAALEVTPAADTAKRNRIRLNLDRWRWLPRELGQKYVIVNVPGFHATLVENGVNRWKQRAIAGSIKTPTPQLSVMATGVILNPWWEVPKSIEPEVRGKAGFVPLKGKDGKVQRWRQPPGPSNALGQMKFVMPNSKAIYLHDTNARSRFNDKTRALSHGCIRTQNIHDLAAELGSDDGGEWTRAKIDEVLASKKTVEAKFVKPVPVYIVYFTQAALNDGRIVDYRDFYGRDSKAMAALQMKDGGASLAKPKTEVASR